MASSIASKFSIKDKLDITYNILSILVKNNKKAVENKYNKKYSLGEQENSKYIRKRSPQFFCTNFCGGNINDCTCLHRSY
jgi:hypothetical protein